MDARTTSRMTPCPRSARSGRGGLARTLRWFAGAGLLASAVGLAGCRDPEADGAPVLAAPTPTYDQPLPEGAAALRRLEPLALADALRRAWEARDSQLLAACDASLSWFDAPSSQASFPFTDGALTVTHARARASVVRLKELLLSSADARSFANAVAQEFEAWGSVGWDGDGTVLFTGYYAPEFAASDRRTARFRAPLYRRPADLVTDASSGAPLGRRAADGSVVPYFTRAEIEDGDLLAGTEIAWLEDELSAFLVHVNGSAKLLMDDGTIRFIGYDGKTDRPYASLGRAMRRDGLLPDGASIPAIRRVFRATPQPVRDLMRENESFVFFTEYDGGRWPSGSLGVPVRAMSSIATDKSIFPRGGPVLIDTQRQTFGGGPIPLTRLVLDQDTGGAIVAPGRADIFMGIGAAAGILAGRQAEEGRMIYLFLASDAG